MDAKRVKEIFDIKEDNIVLPNNAEVSVEKFAQLFSKASENPTYQELVNIDGGNMGYIAFFDRFKEQGILD